MRPPRQSHGPLAILFRWFNRGFDWMKGGYVRAVEFLVRVRWGVMVAFVLALVATGWIYITTPQGFIPEEDQGYFFILNEGPPNVLLNYTGAIVKRVEELVLKYPEVAGVTGLAGFGLEGSASNKGVFFVKLKPWDERAGAEHSVFGVLKKMNQELSAIAEARLVAVNAPPVDGLGSTGGLEFYIQNRAALPMEALVTSSQQFMAATRQRPELAAVFTQFTNAAPIMQVSIDRNQAKAQKINIDDIFGTMQTYLGGNYVNQYVLGGRLYRVYAQAEGDFRSNPADIHRLYVRSQDGNLVQMSSLVRPGGSDRTK